MPKRPVTRITMLALLAAFLLTAPQDNPASAAENTALQKRLDQFLRTELAAQDLPGAALAVIRGPEILYLAGYGTAGGGQPVTPQTQFHIASASKSFTALAVLQLVEQGRINLDAPVVEYIPEFSTDDPDASRRITVRHLLNQTSGLGFAGFASIPAVEQPRTIGDLVPLIATADLVSEPGTAFNYFDPNYGIAARIVEVVTGEPFAEWLDGRVLRPLGMRATIAVVTADEAPPLAPNLSEGFRVDRGELISVREAGYLGGSGGVVSTAEDLANYLMMRSMQVCFVAHGQSGPTW